jgi:ABC-2 type transport system permease protein
MSATARIVRAAVLSGAADYWAIYTGRSWLLGWLVRVLSQVTFFAMMGRLLQSQTATQFILVGNAVFVAAFGAVFALNQTSAERSYGTLPLLLASPARPVVVFAARGLYVMLDGVGSSLLALFVVGAAFGVRFHGAGVALVVPLTLLVGASAYTLSTFLSGVILRRRRLHNIVVNLTITGLMTCCAVNVPLGAYPHWLAHLSYALPVTNGLRAIRAVLAGSPLHVVGRLALLELAVAGAWATLAAATFGRFMRAGRRDGSLDFSS